jgi:hypothetical protein
VLATAAALGAVATGTVTALLPSVAEGAAAAPEAPADGPIEAALTASTAALTVAPDTGPVLTPVLHVPEEADGVAIAEQHLASVDKAGRLAAEAAERLAREERERAEQARIAALIASGGVDGWIAEALQILDLPQSLAPAVKRIVMAESGGNPNAINNWDINAQRGIPSQGLMQTIPSTYRAFVHPDLAHQPITHPVANITAGIRYMVATYGMDTLAAGGRTNSQGNYIGY